MADIKSNMEEMKDKAADTAADIKDGTANMRERMEEKMHTDATERSANEE